MKRMHKNNYNKLYFRFVKNVIENSIRIEFNIIQTSVKATGQLINHFNHFNHLRLAIKIIIKNKNLNKNSAINLINVIFVKNNLKFKNLKIMNVSKIQIYHHLSNIKIPYNKLKNNHKISKTKLILN
jgi:hypothetical protein